MNKQTTSGPVKLDIGARGAVLRLEGHGPQRFDVRRVDVLTLSEAQKLALEVDAHERPLLLAFERSSPEARSLLRERRVSYAADNGELFVFAPPVYVERPATRRAVQVGASPAAPFAARGSRVPRWLLLHRDEQPSFRELARTLQLSEALVSRVVRGLADDGLVLVEHDPGDARVRRVSLRNAGAMLDAFERSATARQSRRVTWDVGARDAAAAIELLREAADRVERPYAVGGLAGASLVRHAVEPVDVTLWIGREDLDIWAEALLAAPAPTGPGRITARLAPDLFMFSLAEQRAEISVADPVQLYLDCRLSGERALEAAAAIRMEMDW